MRKQITSILWTCDHNKCKAHANTMTDDTPPGWTSFSGAMQYPSGGGPASFDLCPRHATMLHKTYTIHTDLDDEDDD